MPVDGDGNPATWTHLFAHTAQAGKKTAALAVAFNSWKGSHDSRSRMRLLSNVHDEKLTDENRCVSYHT